MHDGKGHMAEKRLARQPDHDVGVFPERPQHRDILDAVKRFTENIDALAFELIQPIHQCAPAIPFFHTEKMY
jgi:hypothetical protein